MKGNYEHCPPHPYPHPYSHPITQFGTILNIHTTQSDGPMASEVVSQRPVAFHGTLYGWKIKMPLECKTLDSRGIRLRSAVEHQTYTTIPSPLYQHLCCSSFDMFSYCQLWLCSPFSNLYVVLPFYLLHSLHMCTICVIYHLTAFSIGKSNFSKLNCFCVQYYNLSLPFYMGGGGEDQYRK